MVTNSKIAPIKKLLSEERKFLSELTDNKELSEFNRCASIEIAIFIENGTKIFKRREIVFGEEEIANIPLVQSLATHSTAQISNAIITFQSAPSDETFSKLINAYILELLTFVASTENFYKSPVTFLESDIALLYILVLTLLPEALEKVEKIFLLGLQHNQKIRDASARQMKNTYGRDCTLYLAYWLARQQDRPEPVTNELSKYLAKNIEPCYIEATANAFTDSTLELQKIVTSLAEYHIKNSKPSDITQPFRKNHWIYFPVEILGILKIREKKSIPNTNLFHPLVDIFTPFLNKKVIIEKDIQLLIDRVID